MKKAILILIILSNIIFPKDLKSKNIPKNYSIKYSVGFGYPGIFFREHTSDGYLEYVGLLYAYQKKESALFGLHKAKYLSKYKNNTFDVALSYVYGADISYKSRELKTSSYESLGKNSDNWVGASIGISIERINPRRNGMVLDLFIGEKLYYFFEEDKFAVNPMFRLALLFNY